MEKQGSKHVEITAADDKQIMAVLAGSLAGDFLLPQLIYKGTTLRCLPSTEFPKEWDITYNAKHWSNEITMLQYIHKILLPYIY